MPEGLVEINHKHNLTESEFERNKTDRIAALCAALAAIKDDKSSQEQSSYYKPDSDRAKLLGFLSTECFSSFQPMQQINPIQ